MDHNCLIYIFIHIFTLFVIFSLPKLHYATTCKLYPFQTRLIRSNAEVIHMLKKGKCNISVIINQLLLHVNTQLQYIMHTHKANISSLLTKLRTKPCKLLLVIT